MVICLFHHYNFVYSALFVFIGMPPNDASLIFVSDEEHFPVFYPISELEFLNIRIKFADWKMMLREYMRTQEQKHEQINKLPLLTLWY